MGRPSLGSAARNVLLATKGTQAEADALIARYGSVYAGMRFALRMALESDVRSEGAPKDEEDSPLPSAPHRHRRGKELDPTYEAGSVKRRYACTVEGCAEVLS